MKAMRKLTAALIIIALVVMLFPVNVLAADVQFVIYHTNDIHGRAKGNDTDVIGYARYKQIIDADRANTDIDEVLVFDAGDAIHGTLFAQFSSGESMIDLMSAVGTDAMTSGNHEFDYGADQLLVLEGKASFPIMGANIKKGSDDFLSVNHKTFEVNGKKITVFGVTTPETKVKAHPNYTKGLSFGAGSDEQDLAAFALNVQAAIDGLRDDADVLIMMGHIGVDQSSPISTTTLVPLLTGLDLVIDGHSHTVYNQTVADKDGVDVPIAQTGSYFANVGRIKIEFDGAETRVIPETITFADVKDLPGDAGILAMIQAFEDENDQELGTIIGKTATNLEQFGDFRGGDVALTRVRETNLGNLVADALRLATGADLAMTNGGGIRANIPAGDISFGDAVSVLPFGNLITVIRVTGQDIIDALAHGAKGFPAPGGGFPQVSGMSYTIVTEITGDVESFTGITDVLVDGTPIDPAKSYTLATNDFMAVGGDGYEMFEDSEQVLLHGLMLEAFIELIEDLTAQAGPSGFVYTVEGRIKVNTDGQDAVLPATVEKPASDWKPGGGDLAFVLNGEVQDLRNVFVNGEVLDPAHYEAEAGSTIVTVSKDYLETLEPGKYEFGFEFSQGESVTGGMVTVSLEVYPEDDMGEIIPTGQSMIYPAAGVLFILMAAGLALASRKRRDVV
ncbi:MAG TPA: bifunctional metallophosphatase/5'-nucleotidase [Clostridiaceae bacterium]|nr:bifunctional metallophosphatase/5'-nucleotidase [Clostridiaceae bacterium]